jgi:2-polyprenyl-3-methyl-5-hydroxy-6-metoxy-1,4-benzoquinol methylase
MNKLSHDLSFYSGERQTASEYSAIRADHRLRYEWADRRIPHSTFGVDAFCGNGYGTWLLSKSRYVIGIDGSEEAIQAANHSFRRTSNLFSTSYFPFDLPYRALDFVVALESIEHVADGQAFYEPLCRSIKPGGTLIFSTPCEDLLPHKSTGNHFHHKHYSLEETLNLSRDYGMELMHFAGQNTYYMTPEGMQGSLLPENEMGLKESEAGQFIIVFCRKSITAL